MPRASSTPSRLRVTLVGGVERVGGEGLDLPGQHPPGGGEALLGLDRQASMPSSNRWSPTRVAEVGWASVRLSQ